MHAATSPRSPPSIRRSCCRRRAPRRRPGRILFSPAAAPPALEISAIRRDLTRARRPGAQEKTKMLKFLWAFLAAITLSGCGYNDFQTKDEQVKAAWGEVLNQYQRR